jgi:hypothetical protein
MASDQGPRRVRGGGRIVFLTGDLLTRRTQEFLARTRVRCLRKPFALGDVRTLVQHIFQINEPH